MQRADLGYEPHRIDALHTKTTAAIGSLRGISSSDPSADVAMAAVRALLTTLESGWMPAIGAVRTSRALIDPVRIHGFGAPVRGGGSSRSWDKSADGPEQGPTEFQPFNALSALFPGDDDITAEEIAERIDEILSQDPSEQQALELGVLGRAMEEIAMNTQLSADLVMELGADGIALAYDRLFVLGLHYPIGPTEDGRMVAPDILGMFVEPFGQVMSQGARRASAAEVIAEAIANTEDAYSTRDMATLAGLARADRLPPDLAGQLLDRLLEQADAYVPVELSDDHNHVFDAIPVDIDALIAILFGGNPSLVTTRIHDGDDFVDGGEELFADLIETGARGRGVRGEVGQALGDVIDEIFKAAGPDGLIVIGPNGRQTGEGAVYDVVRLLMENDFKVTGFPAMELIAPYLPEITNSFPGSNAPFDEQEVRALMKDLFNDMSSTEVEAALALIVASAIARIPDFYGGEFTTGEDPENRIGDLLDGLLGPAAGGINDVIDDRAAREALWEKVLNQAFGLVAIPGGKYASFAVRQAVSAIIGETLVHDASGVAQIGTARGEAIVATVAALYSTEHTREAIVDEALGNWVTTESRLRTQFSRVTDPKLVDAEIEKIRDELERSQSGGSPVDIDVFMELPNVVDLVSGLEDELAVSPEEIKGN